MKLQKNIILGKMNKEYRKCIDDPVYFIEHYCVITNKGNKQIKLNDVQKLFINKFLTKYF